MMALRPKRSWNFKRSYSRDRVFLDWFGSKKEPKPLEGMSHVSELVSEIASDAKLDTGVTLDLLRRTWGSVAGQMVAQNSEPLSIEKGVLSVRVMQPVIRFELQQMKGLLIKNIRDELPEAKVRSIKLIF